MTATTFRLAATRLMTWTTAAILTWPTFRQISQQRRPAAFPGAIGGAVTSAQRRSANLTRRDLARTLSVRRAGIRLWETGAIPLYSVPYEQLSQLADALSDADAADTLNELLLAAQCDHLIASLLQQDEDFADVPPIDEDTAEGAAARALLRWAIRGPAPDRYQHLAPPSPLLPTSDADRIASIAKNLAKASDQQAVAAYAQALLLLSQPRAGSKDSFAGR